jgi:SAM-dependent methyltransferase
MIARWQRWARESAELLDDPRAAGDLVLASLRDVERINAAFGNRWVAARRCAEFWRGLPAGTTLSLLDVGTGLGDIPRAVAALAARAGVRLTLCGLERHAAAARGAAQRGGLRAVIADGGALPFRDRSFDLVLCAKLLHHLPGAAGWRLVAEMNRVARRGAVVLDIRRSPLAAAGIWLASYPMRFHPATRRDALISVFRGFTVDELASTCSAAGVRADVRRHPGFCLTAAWRLGDGA